MPAPMKSCGGVPNVTTRDTSGIGDAPCGILAMLSGHTESAIGSTPEQPHSFNAKSFAAFAICLCPQERSFCHGRFAFGVNDAKR